MTPVIWTVLGVVLLSTYITWTAGRLDRMHARVDAAWAALETALVRRAAAARALVPLLPEGPEAAALLTAAEDSLAATEQRRDEVENALSRALRLAVPLLAQDAPETVRAWAELETAATRVGLARSFHNSAVNDTRVLRRRRMPRLLRLAGHRAMPEFFDVDDTALA